MKFNQQPEYTYQRHRGNWRVYRNTYHENGGITGHSVGEFYTKEEARNEVYRLNGWKLKNEI